ncbi:MAG: DUF4386 domain-containing protein [Candidatus Bathyarchaeota archaeon]|nr:DUF4386 domain-containing protein [Candidatus Bathyarchaeota archaeon]
MDSNRKAAIIVGVLFLIATIIIIIGGIFSLSIYEPDYLTAVSANENQVILGALLEIIAAAAIVGIPIAMFPILKKHNEGLALGYVGTRIFEGLTIFLNTIILLSILALSQEFVNTVTPDASYFQTSGALLLALREQISILVDFPFPLGAVIFNYLLYQTKLAPRWLAVLGLIGGALWLATAPVCMFGLSPPMIEIFALPIAAQEMILAVWLIVKGFNSSAIAS